MKYKIEFADPCIKEQSKINAAIMIKETLHYDKTQKGINYVSVELNEKPLKCKTKFISLYLQPGKDDQSVQINMNTLNLLLKDITECNLKNMNLVVAGDFNL